MSFTRAAAAAIGLGLVIWMAGSPLVAADDPPADDAPRVMLGVVPQRDLDDNDTVLMRGAGIDSIRIWLSWSQVEANRGEYDWSAPDALVRTAAEAHLTAFPFLFTEPEWAAELDGHLCSVHCGPFAPSSDATRYAWGRFAGAAVNRYGPNGTFWQANPELPYLPIRAWQIWNEQNSPFFFRPRPDPQSYAELLRAAATEIRLADPGAQIVLGGVWSAKDTPSGVVGSARYLRQLYRVPDVSDSFDAIAIHPYDAHLRGVFDQIAALRRAARRGGDGGVDLWVTELGWASSGRPNEGLVKGDAGQARLLSRAFGRLLNRADRYHLRGAYWYAWRDTDSGRAVCRWCAY
jgi:polysaccharide biosynthesis protein PslG